MADHGTILVPIAPSSTLEQTVSHAIGLARERDGGVHLVRTVSGRYADEEPAEVDKRVLERAERRAREAGPDDLSLTTAFLGTDQYMAAPSEHIECLLEYAAANGIGEIVLDPNYTIDATAPTLQSLESILERTGVDFEQAPVATDGWQPTGEELIRAGLIGIVAFVFYVGLGGPTYPFALASGVVTAVIAAALLRNVAFETTPRLGPVAGTVARGLYFVPYLLWEITKANVLFAYVVLHPSLPIDPGLDRVDAAVGSGLSVTAFANSITLTPGTLTVDADGHHLLVHSLNQSAREDLLEGVHEAPVRYLFYGSEGADLPGPGERGDFEAILGPALEDENGGVTDE
ncbi:monovalent cation/H+ antiporter subunit E [Salinadaptatus halalkaliphilus]|uniref:Monovalent cation/H+ antiporter subunit E n=1 Tax=Salinadaptatus halalkaliphilus TaxID=2419781 RepID=A0A4S3TFU9_9EURY|nr:monovalent cation/H+ antiporter subunit E [Salinadaptatus halalkaliphilus]THE62751.1 monovalent cation/H+ antiporter subunit E [Salinadaptatus halalkaliphilus]